MDALAKALLRSGAGGDLEGAREEREAEVEALQREIAESSRRQSETDGRRLMDLSEREAAAERRVQEHQLASVSEFTAGSSTMALW